jgi:hypothetical protein
MDPMNSIDMVGVVLMAASVGRPQITRHIARSVARLFERRSKSRVR